MCYNNSRPVLVFNKDRVIMKEAHKVTLVLPEGISLNAFQDMINLALKSSPESYCIFHWIPYEGEKATKFDLAQYELNPIATGPDNGTIFEFEVKNE